MVVLGTPLARSQTATDQRPAQDIQTQQGSSYKLTVKSVLIPLDITVQDRQGHFVTSLRASDFTITDNGIPQRINSFEAPFEHKLPKDATSSTPSTGGPKAYGTTALDIIVLDELNTPFEQSAESRLAIRKFLLSQPKDLPQPTMLAAINDAGFQMLLNYTTDSAALVAALNAHRATIANKLAMGAIDLRLAESFRAIDQIAVASSGLPQRKNLLWIGNGFPGLNPEQLDAASQKMIAALVEHLTNRLLEARMTVYKMDPNGVVTTDPDQNSGDSATSDDPSPYSSALNFSTFVTQTGGLYTYSRNDLARALSDGVAEGSHFYTVTYRPTNVDSAAPYHVIRIATSDPRLVVHARSGYYTNDNSTSDASTNTALSELNTAAVSDLAYTGLSVSIRSLDRDATNQVTHCTLLLADADKMTWTPSEDSNSFSAELLVGTSLFSAGRRILTYSAEHFTLTLSAENYSRLRSIEPAFSLEIPLPQNARDLRIVVRDQVSGKLGSVEMKSIPAQ